LQHLPPVQSPLVLQHGAHCPFMQHVPGALQSASTQHVPGVHVPELLQHWPVGQSPLPGAPLHWHVPHCRLAWSQHRPPVQSLFVVQQLATHWLLMQHPAPEQSASPQHWAAMHVPSPRQHLPAPQSPCPGAPVHGQSPHLRVVGPQHCPPLQSFPVVQHGPGEQLPSGKQQPPGHSASDLHLHVPHCPDGSQHSPPVQSLSLRQQSWHW
jgi:hypothetical protein